MQPECYFVLKNSQDFRNVSFLNYLISANIYNIMTINWVKFCSLMFRNFEEMTHVFIYGSQVYAVQQIQYTKSYNCC